MQIPVKRITCTAGDVSAKNLCAESVSLYAILLASTAPEHTHTVSDCQISNLEYRLQMQGNRDPKMYRLYLAPLT